MKTLIEGFIGARVMCAYRMVPTCLIRVRSNRPLLDVNYKKCIMDCLIKIPFCYSRK